MSSFVPAGPPLHDEPFARRSVDTSPPDDPDAGATLTAATTRESEAVVEIAWVQLGAFDEVDRNAIESAHQRVRRTLEEIFPQFLWKVPRVVMRDLKQPLQEEPSALLETGVEVRDARGCDYVIVITPADLVGRSRRETRAVLSRSLGVGVLSTARIDPWATGEVCAVEEREETLTDRLADLALYIVRGLAGAPSPADANPTDIPSTTGNGFDDDTVDTMSRELAEVADARLEEEREAPRPRPLFYAIAASRNLRTIVGAVRRIRPWMFPIRLGKLTAAAVSAALILTATAESWDLAANNTLGQLFGLGLLALVGTSVFLVRRQGLILGHGKLTEQTVVTRVSLVAAVMLGMATTYTALLVGILLLTHALFPLDLITSWVTSVPVESRSLACAQQSALVAALGLVIGAMGASFERQHDIRHATYVDDEV